MSRRALFLICVIGLSGCRENPHLDRVAELRGARTGTLDEPLPNPTFLTMDGDSVPLHDHLGERLTLVNFGGTWCLPCEREMPELQRLHETWTDEGVAIVSVAMTSPQEELEEWVEDFGLTLTILHGLSGVDWADLFYELRDGVPYTVVVDDGGRMTRFVRGFRDFDGWSEVIRGDLERGVLEP